MESTLVSSPVKYILKNYSPVIQICIFAFFSTDENRINEIPQ